MKLLYLSAHSILEHDQVRLWSRLGIDVFSLGSYLDPRHPGDDKRLAIPEAADHPELREVVHRLDGPDKIWNAKDCLPADLVDWADVILVDAMPEEWIGGNWQRIKHKRVIWRTIGQSGPSTEQLMRVLRRDGLQIVRYSPAERRAFEPMGCFAGEDAMIRFAKDPADWYGWTGEDAVIGNVTQNMVDRAEFCGLDFYLAASRDLPAKPAGPGSEKLPGGIGPLSYDVMREYLRRIRAYLYTGTQPASYTLGLIEAMMTGVPVVSIGPERVWLPALFEGRDIVPIPMQFTSPTPNDVIGCRMLLDRLLSDRFAAEAISAWYQKRAIDLFGADGIGRQWQAFLGTGAVSGARGPGMWETVPA